MKRVLCLLLALLSSFAMAENRVYFVNGIDGDPTKDGKSAVKIHDILVSEGYGSVAAATTIGFWPNPGDGLFQDLIELKEQAELSGFALTQVRGIDPAAVAQGSALYKANLGKIYADAIASGQASTETRRHVLSVVRDLGQSLKDEVLVSHNRVVVVAHSQGNFFVEAVEAYLMYTATPVEQAALRSSLRFVGAASVSASTPNSRYISTFEDQALDLQILQTIGISDFSAAPRNTKLCDSTLLAACVQSIQIQYDPVIHGFQEIYTSSLLEKNSGKTMASLLAKLIAESVNELNPPPPPTHGTWPGTLNPGDTIEIDFSFLSSFSGIPDVVQAGIWVTDQSQGPFTDLAVTAAIYDGPVLLGQATQNTPNAIAIAATFAAPEDVFSSIGLVADFSPIRSRSIAGRMVITLNSGTIAVDPRVPGTVRVTTKNCSRIPCADLGVGTVSAVKLNGLLIVP